MPIWFELVFIMLVAYALGLGLGWLIWGRSLHSDAAGPTGDDTNDKELP